MTHDELVQARSEVDRHLAQLDHFRALRTVLGELDAVYAQQDAVLKQAKQAADALVAEANAIKAETTSWKEKTMKAANKELTSLQDATKEAQAALTASQDAVAATHAQHKTILRDQQEATNQHQQHVDELKAEAVTLETRIAAMKKEAGRMVKKFAVEEVIS